MDFVIRRGSFLAEAISAKVCVDGSACQGEVMATHRGNGGNNGFANVINTGSDKYVAKGGEAGFVIAALTGVEALAKADITIVPDYMAIA
jgi:hypothetical protein